MDVGAEYFSRYDILLLKRLTKQTLSRCVLLLKWKQVRSSVDIWLLYIFFGSLTCDILKRDYSLTRTTQQLYAIQEVLKVNGCGWRWKEVVICSADLGEHAEDQVEGDSLRGGPVSNMFPPELVTGIHTVPRIRYEEETMKEQESGIWDK